MTVLALPFKVPTIGLLNVLVPPIVWSSVVMTAPAAFTVIPSVTSADVSIPSNLVLSVSVII